MVFLAAARDLSLQGFNVILVEGRNRTGGRTFTDENGFEIGGQWIHLQHCNPLIQLSHCHGLETKLQYEFGEKTEIINKPNFDLEDKCKKVINEARCLADSDISLTPEEAFREAVPLVEGLSDSELEACAFSLRIEFEYTSAEWDSASFDVIGGVYEYKTFSLHPDTFYDSIVVDGYSSLVNKILEDGIAANIDLRLATPVTKIIYNAEEGVIVETSTSSPITADAVLVTVPLGVLKNNDIEFVPSLPENIQGSIDRLGYGTFNKVWLTFDEDYFNDHYIYFPSNFDNPVNETTPRIYALNMKQQLGVPVLMLFTGGDYAKFIGSASLAEVESSTMKALREHIPDLPDPLSVQVTRWNEDQFSRGSYSHISQFSRLDDNAAFEKTGSDKLFFAGEHAIRHYFQMVHGAYLSGRREAQRITSVFS